MKRITRGSFGDSKYVEDGKDLGCMYVRREGGSREGKKRSWDDAGKFCHHGDY